MNNYRHPLAMSGAISLMLLMSYPAIAVNPTATENPFEESTSEEKLFSKAVAINPRSEWKFDPQIAPSKVKEDIFTETSLEIAQIPNYYPNTPPSPAPAPSTNFYPNNPSQPSGFYPNTPNPIPPSRSSDIMIPNPEVLIKSNGSSIPDSLQPTMPMAPTLPRAVAPPVGDIAISNINAATDGIDLGTSIIVPRLVLRQAPAREVLAVLARYAGMNLVFTDDTRAAAAATAGQPPGAQSAGEVTVSLDLENEPVEQVFNSVLMISGLQANRRGRTIFVGSQLPQAAQNLISRTIRLNQVKSASAGTFLASQGAEFQRLVTVREDIIDPLTQRVIGQRELPPELDPLTAQRTEGSNSPQLLTGLAVSSDDRLNTITLVGEPRQVQVATSLLTQLDARRRQVAVNVKVVDIALNNDQSFSSSFSFGVNDSFFVQDEGAAFLRFGGPSPIDSAEFNSATGRLGVPPAIPNPFAEGGNIFLNQGSFQFPVLTDGGFPQIPGASLGVSNDFRAVGVSPPENADDPFEYQLPSFFEFPRKFLSQIEATIQSSNGKVLTDPTLVVQEGQQATVKLTQKVIENITTQVDPLSGVRTTTPVLSDAGLTLTIDIDKIDDNGFISLTVSPTIAAIGDVQPFDSGADGGFNQLFLLARRELTSGLIRLRDGQTLILSGIISETDQTITNKVPILGDIPLLGALFRSQTDTKNRSEVIVLLTPQILHDNGQWGYNYTPGRASAEVLRQQGFPVQIVP
ncbi:type II and III secretion system protein [Rippkaea orientalis PCC 8801]|uniref:Type II and III secretion system protein n=1 Tax=Rippkaea orientalis (strain PCC 8801 / RF-1) TaxID=41431 RepID=B7K647_RIPO1|nr:secretin and TonB N-terminal domain-containing protein [Rippkaea orientalis]ACK68100.1 type II and III secretion system protein [Rippkaea orientalis PCC 8801]